MAPQKKDQRFEIRFMVKEGMDFAQIFQRLRTVHGQATLSEPSVRRWINRFKSGDLDVNNKAKSGAPRKRTAAKITQV